MQGPSSVSNEELLAALAVAVRNERASAAEVIAQLAELDRRQLYLDAACSSLYAFCMERLGYSEDGALKRVRVARLAQQLPRVLDELRNGAVHLTGLFLLSQRLTEDNAEALLTEARGKSRRQIEQLLAQWFPRPDVPERVEPAVAPEAPTSTCPERGDPGRAPDASPRDRPRAEPLSVNSYRIELTISAELYAKIEQLKNLLSHAVPSGDLAQLLERAVEALLERETRRRLGVGARDNARKDRMGPSLSDANGESARPRKRRAQKPGSRHIPVDVERAVRERDCNQCTFVDEHGRRCSEARFLTIEHDVPFAFGGPPTLENCRLLCAGHNGYMARLVFGHEHIETKIAQARRAKLAAPENSQIYDLVLSALVGMGFKRDLARRALDAVAPETEPELEALLRAALGALTLA